MHHNVTGYVPRSTQFEPNLICFVSGSAQFNVFCAALAVNFVGFFILCSCFIVSRLITNLILYVTMLLPANATS